MKIEAESGFCPNRAKIPFSESQLLEIIKKYGESANMFGHKKSQKIWVWSFILKMAIYAYCLSLRMESEVR